MGPVGDFLENSLLLGLGLCSVAMLVSGSVSLSLVLAVLILFILFICLNDLNSKKTRRHPLCFNIDL